MKSDNAERRHMEDFVAAALETGARLRGPEASANASHDTDPVERMIATIEAESYRIRGSDLTAVQAVFASQALALDTIFTQLLKNAVEGNNTYSKHLQLALKAQAQSRATLNGLVAVVRPRFDLRPRRATKNFTEQTDGSGNSRA